MNHALIMAYGKALALVAATLQREGVLSITELSATLGILAATTAETEPAQGEILAIWATLMNGG